MSQTFHPYFSGWPIRKVRILKASSNRFTEYVMMDERPIPVDEWLETSKQTANAIRDKSTRQG